MGSAAVCPVRAHPESSQELIFLAREKNLLFMAIRKALSVTYPEDTLTKRKLRRLSQNFFDCQFTGQNIFKLRFHSAYE
jgi:hypothetical protein